MSFLARLKRALVTKSGNDKGALPVDQVSYEGVVADTEIVEPYGLHSRLPIGALVVVFPIDGQEDNRAAIGGQPDKRPKDLEVGEVVLYHPDTQTKIHFKKNGDLDITTSSDGKVNVISSEVNVTTEGDVNITATSANLNVTSDEVNITAKVNIDGDVDITGKIDITGISTAADHDSGGISGKTHVHGGVQTGGSNTGAPV